MRCAPNIEGGAQRARACSTPGEILLVNTYLPSVCRDANASSPFLCDVPRRAEMKALFHAPVRVRPQCTRLHGGARTVPSPVPQARPSASNVTCKRCVASPVDELRTYHDATKLTQLSACACKVARPKRRVVVEAVQVRNSINVSMGLWLCIVEWLSARAATWQH